MRDNGIAVIVGQREGSASWDKAVADGFVPGETLLPIEEAAKKANVIQYLLSDAGQVTLWPTIKACLNKGDALYFSHGFSVVYKDQTGIIPPEDTKTLKAMGVAAVYTPKDYDLTEILADVVRIIEAAGQKAA